MSLNKEHHEEPVLDIDLLIHAALDAGATVKKAKPGEGGIFVNGRRLSGDDLKNCLFSPSVPTNFDNIKNMDVEELARFLSKSTACPAWVDKSFRCRAEESCSLSADKCWIEWLEMECE